MSRIVHQLDTFFTNNDLVHVEFDPDSDDAIYDHPGVKSLIVKMKHLPSQRVKQDGRYVSRENMQAVETRNNLSALKLFFYATRVKQWQRLQAEAKVYNGSTSGNGAA